MITLLGAADRSLLVCAFDTADRRLATIISKNEENFFQKNVKRYKVWRTSLFRKGVFLKLAGTPN